MHQQGGRALLGKLPSSEERSAVSTPSMIVGRHSQCLFGTSLLHLHRLLAIDVSFQRETLNRILLPLGRFSDDAEPPYLELRYIRTRGAGEARYTSCGGFKSM